jgi:hypothetical protein
MVCVCVAVQVDFPAFVWKPIVGERVTRSDLGDVDLRVHNLLELLPTLDADAFAALAAQTDLHFTAVLSDGTVVDLVKGGAEKVCAVRATSVDG